MSSLPLDLERIIFELAALEDTDHDNRVRMTLVAKRVYEWIRPILYRVAIARVSPKTSTSVIQNWRNVQRTDVAKFVRHFLTMLCQESSTLELLSTFRNVENLAIWGSHSLSPRLLKEINDLPLHTLSASLQKTVLDEAIKSCRAFQNLTHLEILGLQGTTRKDYNALVELPKLTHLSVEYVQYVEDEVILNLLECCSSLRVLLGLREIIIKPGDPRYLVFEDDVLEDVEEWDKSANGQTGMWELADIIVEARKGKLFNDNSSCTFSRITWMNNLNDDGVRWYKEWSGR